MALQGAVNCNKGALGSQALVHPSSRMLGVGFESLLLKHYTVIKVQMNLAPMG